PVGKTKNVANRTKPNSITRQSRSEFSAVPNKVSAFISRKPPVNTRRTTNAGDLISSLFSAERIPPADIGDNSDSSLLLLTL
ncbi:unnamed protein product, partial [Brassica rapa]